MARVLLIDDDRVQVEIRALNFSISGHQVRVASGVEQATREFETEEPDCIVMDLRLPAASDGLNLIRMFRASPTFTGRVFVLSGFPRDLQGTAEAALVDAILTKPVRTEALLALLGG